MANQINVTEDFVYQARTNTHNTRVVADGGTVNRLRDLDTTILVEDFISQYANLSCRYSASFGQKNTAGAIDKIYDCSTNNRDLTATAGARPTYNATGRMNKASIDFDGINDLLTSPSFAFASATNSLSICMWINVPAFTSGTPTIFNASPQGNVNGYIWVYRSSATALIIQYRSASANLSITSSIFTGGLFDNTWFHLAITIDYTAAQLKVYRNGILFSTNALTTPVFPSDNHVKCFGGYNGGGNPLTGSLDDMRIYNSLLSLNDVQRMRLEM